MKKRIIVLSLGGSLIVPENIDVKFLEKFKRALLKNTYKYKFVVVCGGGGIARKYISGLADEKLKLKKVHQGMLGIASTRLNARFMTYFFGNDANKGIPQNMTEVKNMLRVYDVVFCGALRYAIDETSDGTCAKLANFFGTDFINLTNVSGLYDKNPKKYRNAKFISAITWKDFEKKADSLAFKPGQHFVLDQTAAKIIRRHRIKTYIMGPDMKNLEVLLAGKKFKGTTISG